MPPRRKDFDNEIASEVFVDRETPKATFEKAAFSIPTKGCLIRTWYGVGGQGKTALARELFRMSSAEVEPSYSNLRCGMVDLHGRAKTDPDRLLLWIRNAFAKSGVQFPAFDLAFTIMWEATRGEEPLPNFLNPWLKRASDMAGDATTDTVILSREIIEEFAETIPGLGFLIKRGARYAFERSKKAWLENTRTHLKRLYRDGEIIPAHDLSNLMPWMLAQDMNHHLNIYPDDRFVLFVDEYESVFDAGGMGARWQDNKFDQHMRSFISETDGLLALFFTRERLQWENNKDWQDDLKDNQHLLGGLSEKDALEWLTKIPVDDTDIQHAMVNGARECHEKDAPIYPLLLDLQVQHWQNLGQKAKPSDFDVLAATFDARLEILVTRLLRDYPEAIEQALHHLAIPTQFDKIAFQHIIKSNNIPVSFDTFDRLKTISIVTDGDNGWLAIHRAIADTIVQLTAESLFSKRRAELIDHFVARANPEHTADVDQNCLIAMSEAIRLKLQDGVDGYISWLKNALEKIHAARKTHFLENIWRQTLLTLQASLGETHPDTLTTRHNLAFHIGQQGRYGEAESEFRAIWEIRRQPDALGETHPDTLTTRGNLAFQIGNQGRYGEAEAEFREIWEIRRQPNVLGETHPDTLTMRDNLAFQIGNQGRYGEAEAEFREIWEIRRQPNVLGETHPDTLTTRHNLANQVAYQGRYGEAEAEFREIWEIRRQPDAFGETHPDTLAARHCLAWQISNQGRYGEAEAELRVIWEVLRQSDALGETHPDTLTTRDNLALQIGNQGRYGEAEAEFREIWEIRRQPDVLGETHPDTLTTRDNLARQIGKQGRYVEAEAEFQKIWEVRRQPDVLGETHPDTLTTRHDLAVQIGNQERYGEAEAEFQKIWEVRRQPDVLGETHPDTLTTRHELARQIGNQGRYGEAEAELRVILEALRDSDALGETHPDILATRQVLASQIGNQGRYGEAEEEFRAVWEIWRQPDSYGPNHPYTLRTRFHIAKMMEAQGKDKEADEFLDDLMLELRKHFTEDHNWVVELSELLAKRQI